MPRKKSVLSLEELCFNIVIRNLKIFQHTAKDLPLHLINNLHQKSIEHYEHLIFLQGKHSLPVVDSLPVDLYFHARTKTIYNLDYYDLHADEIVDHIHQLCRNLQSVHLRKNHLRIDIIDTHRDHISLITINNPHILWMDLSFTDITDNHLSIITKHCPQLQYLKLFRCDCITDEGINHLPGKLVDLYLPPKISDEARVNVLERLLYLRRLDISATWRRIIEKFAESTDNRFSNRTFNIEEIQVILHRPVNDKFSHTVATLFPKLSSLVGAFSTTGSYVEVILKAINCNLLTRLSLSVSADFIRIAAHMCPMLEDLKLRIEDEKLSNDRYLEKPQHVPFKYLRKLDVWDDHNVLVANNFIYLLANCHHLTYLHLGFCSKLTDQAIYDILKLNPLKCVELVHLMICGSFSGETLCELVKSLDSLKKVVITHCEQLSLEDKVKVETLIKKMNWNVRVSWLAD